ncbi:nucleotide exchange factor GrpE [Clostridium sp. NSJ-49]|uniref:Protein GrpE n=1 Tax=Clostridium disporicum TaxID=84024 RepID=A0A174JBB6_9CLOT|nr:MULTISPECIES: nucleotide exchange factor GrpE [Clostridium]MBC5624772.1 nucleotide exchange factor GrpE [Clostridium sp. NSJ-49]MCD2502485.1 nucleotide exchange factor GrpE [Clostridium sp. NSJ-145]MDU6341408.1 nucleotide exchange factor GrpE [Clostridium sp.]CUO96992.1 heat shock protein GrpE [Clostridium disporicum]
MEEKRELEQDEVLEEVKEKETNEEIVEEVEDTTEEVVEENNEEDTLSMVRKLKDEKKKLDNELNTLKDRLMRLSAEYDNFRKRTSKEKEGIYTDACVDVLKELVPVLDNLERAIAVDGSVEDLKKGIEMTIKGFQSSLEKLGVEEIDTTSGFDPNFHQAVMHVQDENFEKNSVAEVFLKGYKRNDKIIRYTMVKVAN